MTYNTDHIFQDCESPPQIENVGSTISVNTIPPPHPFEARTESSTEFIPTPIIPFTDNTDRIQHESSEAVFSTVFAKSLLRTINPLIHFPIAPDALWSSLCNIKAGAECIVVWVFDGQPNLSVPKGVVTKVIRRESLGKVSVKYEGMIGHKAAKNFGGTLPPHVDVKIYKIIWKNRIEEAENVARRESTPKQFVPPVVNHTESDLDHIPMPTQRTIGPDFAPCVVAIYRDIMRGYADASYEERNRIWHRVLSAVKHSLAAVRAATGRTRRRRPLREENDTVQENDASQDKQSNLLDKRAIKKATRLVLENCTKKASKVLDQKIRTRTLTDEETFKKLQDLHPQLPTTFQLPSNSPPIAGVTQEEYVLIYVLCRPLCHSLCHPLCRPLCRPLSSFLCHPLRRPLCCRPRMATPVPNITRY